MLYQKNTFLILQPKTISGPSESFPENYTAIRLAVLMKNFDKQTDKETNPFTLEKGFEAKQD